MSDPEDIEPVPTGEKYFELNIEIADGFVHDPDTLAGILRLLADRLDDAPDNRRYAMEWYMDEYVDTSVAPVVEVDDYVALDGADAEDTDGVTYNELKRKAAELDLDLGPTPPKDVLLESVRKAGGLS